MKNSIPIHVLVLLSTAFGQVRINVHSEGINVLSMPIVEVDSITFSPTITVIQRLIPASDSIFTMGDSRGTETGSLARTHPEHSVVFAYDFYIDSTEVTQKDYHELMSTYYPNYSRPNWLSLYGKGDDYPVYFISWYDAALYCNARSKQAGIDTVYDYKEITGIPGNGCTFSNHGDWVIHHYRLGYRLPTEAEWEYACRAGTNTAFYWGDSFMDTTSTKQNAWFNKNAYEPEWSIPHAQKSGVQPVAQLRPNGFGLYDMIGNLPEFMGFGPRTYEEGILIDPHGDRSYSPTIIRGAGVTAPLEECTSYYRGIHYPGGTEYVRGLKDFVTFRCVLNKTIPSDWKK